MKNVKFTRGKNVDGKGVSGIIVVGFCLSETRCNILRTRIRRILRILTLLLIERRANKLT